MMVVNAVEAWGDKNSTSSEALWSKISWESSNAQNSANVIREPQRIENGKQVKQSLIGWVMRPSFDRNAICYVKIAVNIVAIIFPRLLRTFIDAITNGRVVHETHSWEVFLHDW